MATPSIAVDYAEAAPGRPVATVTVHNEAKLNTLDSALLEQLAAAVTEAGSRPGLAAIILAGAGERAFIGGASIDEMATLDGPAARAFILRIHAACTAIRDAPVPVIARIQGYALGAGLEIAAACDIRVAAESARFGMPEVKVGLPSVVEAALLPALIGWGRTREMLLFGETIDALKAQAWGLIERLATRDELDGVVAGYVASLLAAGPEAVRRQKALIRAWEDLPVSGAIQAGVEAFEASWETAEPRTRLSAFLASKGRRPG